MAIGLVLGTTSLGLAQIDPYPHSLLQLGYDQSVSGQGPQSLYAYYYYNNPEFLRTNVTLRLAAAPVYLDAEIGFPHLLTPRTSLGIGINGGAFGDNYYEVRQGHYIKDESFDGHGGGASLSLYHRLNPTQMIPLNMVLRYGYGFNALRDGQEGTHSVGVLYQYNFEQRKNRNQAGVAK